MKRKELFKKQMKNPEFKKEWDKYIEIRKELIADLKVMVNIKIPHDKWGLRDIARITSYLKSLV